jgi:predicted permease
MSNWLDSLRSDTVFAWRQICKRKMTSAAAILSLGLALGACTSAFRIIDALLLRPLPVAAPDRLYALVHKGIGFDGAFESSDAWIYPLFQQMRDAVQNQADLLAISPAERQEVTYGPDQETEKVFLQYVSGSMFPVFGIRPALGRVLAESDDLQPGAHPVAVLSFDYWTRRFGRARDVAGRTLRLDGKLYTVVGVAAEGFTGVEPGTMTDIFLPAMMNQNVRRSDFYWARTFLELKPGSAIGPVQQRLGLVYRSFEANQLSSISGLPKTTLEGIIHQQVLAEPAAAGLSDMQQEYRTALIVLGVLVFLVLLIACANVANLMMAQAAARAREMALRVSIGAGRARLAQLLLVESALLALFASLSGTALAWPAAPFLVSRINPPDHPARLMLPADWRVAGFLVALTFFVTLLFGLMPAWRVSRIRPAQALKGAEDRHARSWLGYWLTGLQAAFSCLVLFVAGLFLATLLRLSHQPTGFEAARVLTVEAAAEPAAPPAVWSQTAERLTRVPGVESAALADWPLLSANIRGGYISVAGRRPFANPAFFLKISPGWLRTMKIPLAAGRDFRAADVFPRVAIVNEEFVRRFLAGQRVVGGAFTTALQDQQIRLQIVGVAKNARYADLRGPMPPVVYFPFPYVDEKGSLLARDSAAFVIRTSLANPAALAQAVRREITQSSRFRVSNVRTQEEIDAVHTVRERIVAMLGLFFAATATLLAGVGLYGVLDHSVFQRQREIGIRMAVGANAADVAWQVGAGIFSAVMAGAVMGAGIGMASARLAQEMFYRVRPGDLQFLVMPLLVVLFMALAAAAPALLRAVRIDPAKVLRAD